MWLAQLGCGSGRMECDTALRVVQERGGSLQELRALAVKTLTEDPNRTLHLEGNQELVTWELVEAAAEQLGVEPDGPMIAVARICMDRIHLVQRLESRFNTVKIPSINVEVVGTPMGTRIS